MSESGHQLLAITGMSCAGCVRSVESALAAVPGVASASVNFANETALIDGTPGIPVLIAAVQQAGYGAEPFRGHSLTDQEAEAKFALRESVTRSAIALSGGALLMIDMMIGVLPGIDHRLIWALIGTIVLGVMMYTGGHFFRSAWTALTNGTATMDTLIALGTGAAWIYSMLIILAPELVPPESRHQFFEAALFIIGFVNLGKALESNARAKASLAIQRLFDLTPKTVTRIVAGTEEVVPLAQVEVGEFIRVRPGESVPVDGSVSEGLSQVNESMLTGEFDAVPVAPGSRVSAGTINLDGSLIVQTEGVGSDTLLGSMIRLVSEAQNSKPEVARLVDQISAVFVPSVLVIAIVTGFGWWFLGPEPRVSYTLVTTMSVMIVACPCALGLAVPMSIMIGLGRSAENGLLIRNSEVLQTATKITTVVVDKTGTLTLGQPSVVDVDFQDEYNISLTAAVESLSEHPIARSIVKHCGQPGDFLIEDFRNHPGGGVSAKADGRQLLIGSAAFLTAKGINGLPDIGGGTLVFVAVEKEYVGHFTLQDTIRPGAEKIVSQLHDQGLAVVMLSGDRQSVADQVGRQLEIDEVVGELAPEDKLDRIRAYQAAGEVVAMVGDGVNDAVALAAADVGFAMGTGTDVAIESADVTLPGGKLDGVVRSISFSKAINRNIRQNLVAAFGYNLLLIPVAAGVLFPLTGMLINPALAGLAMALSSVSVVFNASRLRNL